VESRRKLSCPACGAEANWNPTKQLLVCPYCGAESPDSPEEAAAVIVEHDLAAAIAAIPASARGWNARKTSVRCESCRAISVFDAEKIGSRCEFCGSTSLVPYEQVEDAFRPESLLPLKIDEPQARDLMRAWFKRQWLAPNGFSARALTDTVKGIYLPYWTFDATAEARWTAESGEYYYTTENRRRVRHVRWRGVSGALTHRFDDDLVCASVGMDPGKLRSVEPFPTDTLVPYDPGYLAGWTVERYQIDLVAAAERSRDQMNAALRRMCADQVPGDTHRNLIVRATFSDQTFKHMLAPVWLLTYLYHATSYQVVLNGVTGTIAGSRPWSWIKISLLVLLALLIFALYATLDQ
jgi:hypothetical protein